MSSSIGFWNDPEPYPALDDSANANQITVAVSRSFHPGNTEHGESDFVLCSSEGVYFYVHTSIINNVSQIAVRCFIDAVEGNIQDGIVMVPETTAILNIIVHTIYDTSCAQHSPTCDELIEAVDKMPGYGLMPNAIIRPDSSLYHLLLSHGALRPIEIYALAAHYNIPALAERVSSHLLAYPLTKLNDNTAIRMGAPYLRRLFALHFQRIDELKKILQQPPMIHPETEQCTFESQTNLARAWAMGTTYLAWEMRPDISVHMIRNVLESLRDKLKCPDCQDMLNRRTRDVLVRWAAVKCTIDLD